MAYTSAVSAAVGESTKASTPTKLGANTDWLQEKANAEHNFDISTGDGSHNPGLFWRSGVVHPTDESAGYTTIQAADDDLDSGAYLLLVKQATYAAGVTVSTNDAEIWVAPGTIIQGAITLSGQNVTLRLGAGCDIQANITLSGAGCSLICANGCTLDRVIISVTKWRVDGGGWDTIADGGTAGHAIDIQAGASDGILESLSVQTTGGGASAYDAVNIEANNNTIQNVRVANSDDVGIVIGSGGSSTRIFNCNIGTTDSYGVEINAALSIVQGNLFGSGVKGSAIRVKSGGDNFNIVGNVAEDASYGTVWIESGGDNGIVDGNVLNAGIQDVGTGNTIGDNEIY